MEKETLGEAKEIISILSLHKLLSFPIIQKTKHQFSKVTYESPAPWLDSIFTKALLFLLLRACFSTAPVDTLTLSLSGKILHCEGRQLCSKPHRVQSKTFIAGIQILTPVSLSISMCHSHERRFGMTIARPHFLKWSEFKLNFFQ